MPARAYRQTNPQARQQLLTRLAAGEPIMAVCAEPGVPSYASVYAWAKVEPGFAAELVLARRKGAFIRGGAFDEAKGQAVLTRLRAGEPITQILRDPATPSRRVYAYWRATQAPFAEEVYRLNQVRAAARAQRGRDRRRHFDLALADAIVVRVSRGQPLQALLNTAAGLPCRGVVARWRRMQPEFDQALRIAIRIGRRRARMSGGCTPALTQLIADEIRQGESLSSLGRRPDMPCAATLYAWVRKQPAFAAEIAQACDDREDWFTDQVMMLADGPGELKDRYRQIAALKYRLGRLQNRPGAKRARAERASNSSPSGEVR
ncbi:MAG: hypothetical protein Q7T84_02135 [Phenylobacterium sp.]|uniref:terminase small subunit-like protein n=1 Tax=Phenylobacterium sp. TaxID=1871053 RepID=UPI0027239AEF|nr:hypothetical protein [Phenylobacterium sp.]MDO9430079.1 hypothetical protein [Phenylobacterium sp.]